MLKKIGVLALIMSASAAILPMAAFAQDGYYYPRDNYRQNDRDWDRHERREWREHERRERRADEWRDRGWRDHEWRERHRYDRRDHPDSYYYFGR